MDFSLLSLKLCVSGPGCVWVPPAKVLKWVGPRSTSKRCSSSHFFLASGLIDRHKLDHLFCPLPQTLLMAFIFFSELLTPAPYYVC